MKRFIILTTAAWLLAALTGCVRHGMMAESIVGLGTRVPLVFSERYDCPRVVASVNGVKGTFLLDTGASECTFSSDFCHRAGIADEPHMTAQASDGHRIPQVWIPQLCLGAVRINRFCGLREDNLADLHVDGSIGLSAVVGKTTFTIDGPGGYIVWGREPAGIRLPLDIDGSIDSFVAAIHVDGELAGQTREFILDTGSTFSYLDPADYHGPIKHVDRSANPLPFYRDGGLQVLQDISIVEAPDFRIGDYPSVLDLILIKKTPAILGYYPLFSDHVITIDVPHQALYIEPAPATTAPARRTK